MRLPLGETCEIREAPFDHDLIGFGTRGALMQHAWQRLLNKKENFFFKIVISYWVEQSESKQILLALKWLSNLVFFFARCVLPITKRRSETKYEIICLHEQLQQKVGKNKADYLSDHQRRERAQLTSLSSLQYCFRATLMGFLAYFLKSREMIYRRQQKLATSQVNQMENKCSLRWKIALYSLE